MLHLFETVDSSQWTVLPNGIILNAILCAYFFFFICVSVSLGNLNLIKSGCFENKKTIFFYRERQWTHDKNTADFHSNWKMCNSRFQSHLIHLAWILSLLRYFCDNMFNLRVLFGFLVYAGLFLNSNWLVSST